MGGPKKNDDARQPRCPAQLGYLYGWFIELSASRSGTGFGPSRLGALDILAGVWLFHRVVPAPWEARALVQLDAIWMKAQAEAAKSAQPPPSPSSGRQRRA